MNNLVFLKTTELHEEPFTTSDVIAINGGVKHHAVQVLISNYQDDLKEFGELSFEMRPVEIGGSQSEKIYHLNEQQATLIITFMKNTPAVREFKKALVKEFYRMKSELNQRRIAREIGKHERKSLTSSISDKFPENKWAFKNFTDLDYKCALGMTAKKFEETYKIPNGKLRDYLQAGQLEQIGILEAATKALIDAGYVYEEIKDILSRKFLAHKSA